MSGEHHVGLRYLVAIYLLSSCGCSRTDEGELGREIPFSATVAVDADGSQATTQVTLTNLGATTLEILRPPLESNSSYYLNGKREVHGVSYSFSSPPEKFPAKRPLGARDKKVYQFDYSIIDGDLEDRLLLQAQNIEGKEVLVELNVVYRGRWGKEITFHGIFPLIRDGKFIDGEYVLELYQRRVEPNATPQIRPRWRVVS